jgi:hypothetical protein
MSGVPPPPRSSASPDTANDVSARARRLRLFWLCLALGLLALVLLVWLFSLTWWAVLIAVLVIACPAIAAWMLLGGFDSWPKPPRTGR